MVAIWALGAALVPEMQKGNDTARTAHIALNVTNTLLFVSQVPTGLEIVGKVSRCFICVHHAVHR